MSWADPAPEDEARCCRLLEFGADGAEMFCAFLDFADFDAELVDLFWIHVTTCCFFDFFLVWDVVLEKKTKAPQTWALPGGGEV